MKCDCKKLIAFITAIVIISVTQIETAPVPELVFNGTKFRFFNISPSIDRESAQTNCESWGGNLATIKSLKEDTILGLLTNTKDYFSCWIGLNDINSEVATNASAFVWADGSNSAYRNLEMFSSDTSGSDCVAYRYMMSNGIISNGWQNLACDQLTNCSYCAKQESSMGCDLIYDGSCYRAFEVSVGINWLDAQSSCAVWGGDLTSIGVLRDQVLLNQYIPDSVNECWIGLHDRDGDGTFQWVDGTTVSYTRWDTNEPGVSTTNRCVELSSTSDRKWKSISCDVKKNSFICEIDLNSLTTTEYKFGELIDGGLNFNSLTGNTFIFKSIILACKGDVNSATIAWQYSVNADLSSSEVQTATYLSTQTGVSWLSVDNTKQGYYQCYIDSTNIYTVGVYDTKKTTVAVAGSTYTYTVGVDRMDVLLLCDPMDSRATLSALKWVVQSGPTFPYNPININNLKDHLSDQSTRMSCANDANTINNIFIIIKEPKMTIMFGSMIYGTFFSVSPSVYHFGVPLSTKDMTISINLEGKWNLPDNTDSFNSQLTISNVTSHDAGFYKFYITNWDGEEQCAMQLRLYATIPGNLKKSVTFGGSTYGYFNTTERIEWLTSQLNCVNWGGNLVTIDSKQVDSLLYYITSDYTCWIGLNDRDNEAENNGSAFVWVDGSTSTYRQWDTVYNSNEPDGNTNDDFDCVSFRYQDGDASGWDDRGCYANVYCYFCQKSGYSRGCDLIYDGSCYRAFEVSDGINWLDAQSSCAVWGGDLTSITTEMENNLLYTTISNTVTICWIGLYERDGDGAYQWVDGTELSYTNWTGSAPTAGSTTDCVQMNTIGAGNWIAADCEDTSNSFICKRPSTNTDTTGYMFGELIDQGLNFRPLIGNTFLYNSTILACKGDVNSAAIIWQYSVNADLSSSEVLTATYMSTQTGVSWYSVENTKQGYYQCYIDSTNRYTVGVYDTQKTTVASGGILYHYIVGIDREDVVLLCDPMDSMYNLSSLSWHVNGETFSNPFNISARNSLPELITAINCLSNSTTILATISIYVPEITVTYSSSNTMKFSTLYPGLNTIPLMVEIDVSISTNTTGRWKLQNGTYVSSSTVSYPIMKFEYFGLYQFYVNDLDGNEVCVIQITIVPEGYSTTNSISLSNSETIQNGSTIVITDNSSMINCIISNPDYSVEWFYRSQLGAVQTDVTSSSTFSVGTGISTLNVYSNEPGYYSCVINTNIVYSFFVADRDSLIEIPNFQSPSQQVDYIVGTTSSLLYYSVANIPDTSLRWTTETVTDGTDTQYSIEYPNPVPLSTVFSDVGAGVQTFSCFYRMSPVTLVGSLQLAIRDTAIITISYEGYTNTFSDAINTNFPASQQIRIPTGTPNVTLRCNESECVGIVKSGNLGLEVVTPYIIPIITEETGGEYSLIRKTANFGKDYTTAHVYIQVLSSASIQPLYIAVPAGIILILFCLIVVCIIIFCILKNKRKNSQFTRRTFRNESSDSPVKSQMVLGNNELDTAASFTPGYSKIDEVKTVETKFIETDDQSNTYENIATEGPTYQEASEVVEPRMIPIPLDLYKSHIDRIWQKEGSLLEEYESLGTKANKYSTITATLEENRIRNRFKLIYPYDKSRVILNTQDENAQSDYINASHIPGVYVKECFIAAQAPKENTLQDFWQMVMEYKVATIVMVTNFVESGRKKCEEYFPLKVGKNVIIGPYEIVLDNENVITGYTIRMMSVHYKGKIARVKHFHFTAWPDHDVPTLYDELLLFVSKVQEGLIKTKAPMLVHCSAGVGRTGTFITLYNLQAAIQQSKPISIYSIVHEMREHRPQMVQTFAQYKFIYLSVLEMLLGKTSVPTEEFITTFDLYMQSENEGYVSVFFQQYSELNYQCDKGFEHVCKDAIEDSNSNKNPVKNILPCDKNRVLLFSSHWPGDYINGTFLDNKEILVTIHPTKKTLRDFYQLLYQMETNLVVMLCSKNELQSIEQNKSQRVLYWPKFGESVTTEPFIITCEASEKTPHFIRNTLKINHTLDQCSRNFTQIIANNWNERDEPHLKRTVVLLQTIIEFRQRFHASPIIIHCADGAGKSGVIYTVYRAIRDSTEKGYIDIFHIVKKLRNERMKSITSLTYFVSCYTLMNEFINKV